MQLTLETSLTQAELDTLKQQEKEALFPSFVVIGKAGAGKDTIGEYLAINYGYGTDAMATTLKEIARVVFRMKEKDRVLLQALSNFRKLLPSCYLDNTWRRIMRRRKLAEKMTILEPTGFSRIREDIAVDTRERFEFQSIDDVLQWIKSELFPETPNVTFEHISGILADVACERYGMSDWQQFFAPCDRTRTLVPTHHVVLTDIRFPNELALALEIGVRVIWVQADEDIRIERLRLRDGSVDPARLYHESETALDELLASGVYSDKLILVDNNGTYEDLYEQVENIMLTVRNK